jgi:hypothetical protein
MYSIDKYIGKMDKKAIVDYCKVLSLYLLEDIRATFEAFGLCCTELPEGTDN